MAIRTTTQIQDIPPAIAAEDRSDLPLDRADLIDKLRRLAPDISAYGVTSLYLYGSYARAEADAYSDVDVFVEYRDPFSLIDLVRVQHTIEAAIDLHTDVTTRNSLTSIKSAAEGDAIRIF